MMKPFIAVLVLVLANGLALSAKDKKISNEFNAPAASVYDAVYRYAQRHGTIKWADEKRFTLSGSMSVPGGNWDHRKDFDCTISVEASEGGKKSVVDVVGTYPRRQQSLVGSFGEGPARKVLRAIREEFDNLPQQSSDDSEHGKVGTQDGRITASTSTQEQSGPERATLDISSWPSNADIEIDSSFSGNTPSSLGVAPGEHTLRISKAGYTVWERKIKSLAGRVSITAELKTTTTLSSTPSSADHQIPSNPATPLPPEGTSETPRAGTPSGDAGQGGSSASVSYLTDDVNEEPSIGVKFLGKPTARHDGVEVRGIQQGGPANALGIATGDLILAIDGHYIFTIQELHTELNSHAPGSRVGIRYRRNSLIYDNTITLRNKQP